MRLAVAVFIALLCAAAQAGEVYKWVDKDGVVHYGDQPKHEAETVQLRNADAAQGAEPETDQAQAARAAECQRKRAQLESYRNASTIKETDNLGRTREYSSEERERLITLTEQQVAAACAPAPAAE